MAEGNADPPEAEVNGDGFSPSPEIFRAYDIRGIVGETLTADAVYGIARAFATRALGVGQRRVVVGGDGRRSTVTLRRELARGLRGGGVDVVDIGVVPTPLLYYATHVLDTGTGVMITGSHNPSEYNGLKMVLDRRPLSGDAIQGLRTLVETGRFSRGDGGLTCLDLIDRYVADVVTDTPIDRSLKVVIDCGNGVAGLVAPRLLATMGCEVISLYAEVDGDFPNHHPDPAVASNMADLIAAVDRTGADLGLAFDGDADRLGVVTDRGDIVWPDRLMMLLCRSVVSADPGATVVFDVKCSRHLSAVVRDLGGSPVMCKTGHSHIKAKIREADAAFGGEFSGHICFADRWYGFDDALYCAARLVQVLASEWRPASGLFADFPDALATPEIKVPTSEQRKFDVIDEFAENAVFDTAAATVTAIDGIRVDYPDGWGLVRASNTSPMLSLRFEADTQQALDRIQTVFDAALVEIDPALSIRNRHP
ncbi:MAG: phosphomannomutase/phosphoglucomutase [Gammaproteobacteria bacterium]|nr:phosphomannomutase/phosphoglucomutase [Gammaproteobacteria bacterium]MYF30085.1 phosphomannomutase/phosphoglucomutase [Gammaproteobacteria bacterium]MYK47452.1 phosphomannomutase/phosphoglucomutase [Gammaproteobacteria bacterium]